MSKIESCTRVFCGFYCIVKQKLILEPILFSTCAIDRGVFQLLNVVILVKNVRSAYLLELQQGRKKVRVRVCGYPHFFSSLLQF